MKKLLYIFIPFILIASFLTASPDPLQFLPDQEKHNFKKELFFDALEDIHNLFSNCYAPLTWKKNYFGLDLEKEKLSTEKRLQQAFTKKSTSLMKAAYLSYLNNLRDEHVMIEFYDPEVAYIKDLRVKALNGKLYISHSQIKNVEVGDEIIRIEGLTPYAYFQQSDLLASSPQSSEYGKWFDKNNPAHQIHRDRERAADLKHATSSLFYRRGAYHIIPSNPLLSLEIKSRKSKKTQTITCKWQKSSSETLNNKSSKQAIGIRHISQKNKTICWITLPSFTDDLDTDQIPLISAAIQQAKRQGNPLVIDIRGNPGGSIDVLHFILSLVIDKPIVSPVNSTLLTQQTVFKAKEICHIFEFFIQQNHGQFNLNVCNQVASIFNLPAWQDTTRNIEIFKGIYLQNKFILQEHQQGKKFTRFSPLFGVESLHPITPNPNPSSPLYVCINEHCYSCADIFPAILQDNHAATLIGRRTAGAGGTVESIEFPSHPLIKTIGITSSLILRSNGRFIENLGVEPDILYEESVEDLFDTNLFEKSVLNHIEKNTQ